MKENLLKEESRRTKKEISRRDVVKGIGLLVAGAALGSAGTLFLKNPRRFEGNLEEFFEKMRVKNQEKNFARIKSYSAGTIEYVAKPGDSYSRMISNDVKANSCLRDFEGSDLREYYRSLNEDRDMREGAEYSLPKWNCAKR